MLQVIIDAIIIAFKDAHDCNEDLIVEFLEIGDRLCIEEPIIKVLLVGEVLGQVTGILEEG